MNSRITVLTLTMLTTWVFGNTASLAAPMGTAFTYQGRFNAGGTPANGAYDFEFRLFDAATAGNQVGSTVTKGDLAVADGYFTTTLDFGSGRFTGDARWLQIAVRPGAETGAYTTLTPRHELTPTPYAINSDNEGTANYIPKITSTGIANSILYESSGRVGLGTTTPARKLDVSTAGQITFGDTVSDDDTSGIYWHSGTSYGIYRTAGAWSSPDYQQIILNWLTGIILNPGTAYGKSYVDIQGNGLRVTSGKVGIGTTSPSHLLTTADTGTVAAVNLSNVLYVDAAYNRVGIGMDNPVCGLDIRCADAGINVQAAGNPYLELRSTNGGYAVIDLSNDASIDYDVRMWILGDDILNIDGGYVGIGTTSPTQKLHVVGNIYCSGVYQGSDEQLKTDIQPLDGVLDKLSQIRGVSFRWNDKARSLGAKVGERHIGVLAQELEKVFPEMVATPQPVSVEELTKGLDPQMLTPELTQRLQQDAEATHYKAVNYSQLTVVLLEAVKELREENQSLRQRIEALENKAQ